MQEHTLSIQAKACHIVSVILGTACCLVDLLNDLQLNIVIGNDETSCRNVCKYKIIDQDECIWKVKSVDVCVFTWYVHVCLFLCLFVCLLFVCLSVCLSVCVCVSLYVYMSVCLYLCVWVSVYLSDTWLFYDIVTFNLIFHYQIGHRKIILLTPLTLLKPCFLHIALEWNRKQYRVIWS
jgi:hypothetical protein